MKSLTLVLILILLSACEPTEEQIKEVERIADETDAELSIASERVKKEYSLSNPSPFLKDLQDRRLCAKNKDSKKVAIVGDIFTDNEYFRDALRCRYGRDTLILGQDKMGVEHGSIVYYNKYHKKLSDDVALVYMHFGLETFKTRNSVDLIAYSYNTIKQTFINSYDAFIRNEKNLAIIVDTINTTEEIFKSQAEADMLDKMNEYIAASTGWEVRFTGYDYDYTNEVTRRYHKFHEWLEDNLDYVNPDKPETLTLDGQIEYAYYLLDTLPAHTVR